MPPTEGYANDPTLIHIVKPILITAYMHTEIKTAYLHCFYIISFFFDMHVLPTSYIHMYMNQLSIKSIVKQMPTQSRVEPKSSYRDCVEELKMKEVELWDTKHRLETAEEDVKLHANNLSAMETIMSKQHAQLNAELQAARDEIAVKVAQVKQYQKQVEAYKQQVIHSVHLSAACIQALKFYITD